MKVSKARDAHHLLQTFVLRLHFNLPLTELRQGQNRHTR